MKTFVLDTSVLLHDPMSIYSFGESNVVIPAVVIEEIDKKKNLQNSIGKNAREFARELDKLKANGGLSTGVKIKGNGFLRVEINHKSMDKLTEYFSEINNDNRILSVALNLKFEEEKNSCKGGVVLVSKDVIMRIKADSLNIHSQDYKEDKVNKETYLYEGYHDVYVTAELIDEFYNCKEISIDDIKEYTNEITLLPNEFLHLKDIYGSSKSAIGKINFISNKVEGLIYGEDTYWGIKGKNLEQRMALEILMDDNIKLVTLTGKAGTGKTLLSLAAGLYKTNDKKLYKKLIITKPVIPVGRDIGYLPGDKDDKLRYWVQPIYDNLEFILGTKSITKIDDTLVGMNRIEIEALTYIRGRSIPNQFMIIDEAQNLTKHEVKTIVTRVGDGTKIILMGDTDQIDHPYLDKDCNGLTYLINIFRGQEISSHINFKKVERSSLAQLAAELL